MALFKRAYAHGSMKALIDAGAIKVANEELAAALADEGSEGLPEEPVGEVAPEATAELAANLVELSNSLQESAGNAAQAAEAVTGGGEAAPVEEAPVEVPPEMEEAKAASVKRAAAIFRRKLAEGSTITGDRPEQENDPSTATSAESKMDQQQRPENFANVGEDGVGMQEAAGKGKVGDEEKVEGVGMGPVGQENSNSAEEQVGMKSASIRNLIKAATQGKQAATTVGVGATPEDASTGELSLDDQNRPGGEGYANKGVKDVGETVMVTPAGARVGEEKAHPGQDKKKDGSNTVIQETKVGEDEEYMKRFKQVGAKYANQFPFFFDRHQKVATVQYLMSLPPNDRDALVDRMQKTAEVPEALKNYMGGKDEKDDEGEEKKASVSASRRNLLSRLRSMQA
jgi:hypothetical protein